MKTSYLFPPVFRKIGWWLFVPFLAFGLYSLLSNDSPVFRFSDMGMIVDKATGSPTAIFSTMKNKSVLDELCIVGLTVSLFLIAFSREKDEDECIGRIRLQALLWSLWVSYSLLILATLFLYSIVFLKFTFVNLFLVPVLFIVKYNWDLYRFRRDAHE